MNLISQINNILRRFETGDKLKSYKELKKIFNKNKNNNLLRYNLAVIQQNLNLNEEARIKLKFRMMVRTYLIALLIVVPILYVGFRLRYYVNIF